MQEIAFQVNLVSLHDGSVAQSVEHLAHNRAVFSSILNGTTNYNL